MFHSEYESRLRSPSKRSPSKSPSKSPYHHYIYNINNSNNSNNNPLPNFQQAINQERNNQNNNNNEDNSYDIDENINNIINNTINSPSKLSSPDESQLAYNLILKNEIFRSVGGENHQTCGSINFDHYQFDHGHPNNIESVISKSSVLSPTKGNNILKYKSKKSSGLSTTDSPYSLSPLSDDSQKLLSSPRKPQRKISKYPFKILEAPAIKDDFYLNLVDWNSQNILAVGLDTSVYLWNGTTSQVSKLCDFGPNQPVTSVSWIQRGSHLAVGRNDGLVQIWDAVKKKKVRELQGHTMRVSSLAWNSHILSSGGKDKLILHHDVRDSSHFTTKLIGHRHEICGLKWSPDGQQLASGGNDNLLNVWDASSTRPLHQFRFHNAAIKAIAWSPHQRGLLASGGGTHDKCIRFWNTNTGTSIQSIDTGSQVCNLAWSKNVNELVSTHGYSQNQVTVWNYPSLTPVTTLTGHTMRVLYLAVSPDGQTIVTGAGDQTLRFWNVFPHNRDSNYSCSIDSLYTKHDMDIR
eukprot:gene4116-5150_t